MPHMDIKAGCDKKKTSTICKTENNDLILTTQRSANQQYYQQSVLGPYF